MSIDSVFRTRSLGVAAQGIPDQYADGKAAKVWELYVGSKSERTESYKSWICNLLREKGCKKILDVACGTGVDSVMLLEEGFSVTSVDASDKMLKYALKERWHRRKEAAFDEWVIEEANWLTLAEDLEELHIGDFDAVICLGNSFPHLPDFEGNLSNQKLAFKNFEHMVKPGGIMVIDHRNYDAILDKGSVPQGKNIYYKGTCTKDIKTSVLYVNGRPHMITLDYTIDTEKAKKLLQDEGHHMRTFVDLESYSKFRLSYYPHRLNAFTELLKEAFGSDSKHAVYGDFKPLGDIECPAYYVHVVEKPC
ncbi:glycine N-methyltransferase-like [Saccoglossus kowalevskii]|uniref:Glycine N-methyltransferase n=1 Tax=Saccoglossus kowalevskii TaxID=10224 RepID=A0ABM0H098_SACKO|nr:PREDICTED: glycine N-methyltransferase-like [Saccoglossus kowalevskii]